MLKLSLLLFGRIVSLSQVYLELQCKRIKAERENASELINKLPAEWLSLL